MNYTLGLYKYFLSFSEIEMLNDIYGKKKWEVEDIPIHKRREIEEEITKRMKQEIIDEKIKDEIQENQLRGKRFFLEFMKDGFRICKK